ncbi:MAG: hypothetical protein FRX49_04585, partial [Trebouxia sp. A1-2]
MVEGAVVRGSRTVLAFQTVCYLYFFAFAFFGVHLTARSQLISQLSSTLSRRIQSRSGQISSVMEDEFDEDTLQALALSMQEWDGQGGAGDQGSDAVQALPDADPTLQDMDVDDDLQQAMTLSMQDQYADDEPAPPPDTVMLTEQQQAAAAMPPAQQQPHQPAAAPTAPQPAIQFNVFAAALAQAMGVLNQQQGVPQAEPTRQAATRPAKVYAKTPAWIEAAVSDLKRPLTPAGSDEAGVSFPPEDELPIVAALEKALGMPVKAVQGTSAAPAGMRGLVLRLTMDPKTDSSWWL